jgi:hypothetical protein
VIGIYVIHTNGGLGNSYFMGRGWGHRDLCQLQNFWSSYIVYNYGLCHGVILMFGTINNVVELRGCRANLYNVFIIRLMKVPV